MLIFNFESEEKLDQYFNEKFDAKFLHNLVRLIAQDQPF